MERDLLAIPGVVGTGLFLGMAEIVLVGDRNGFGLIEEKRRREAAAPALSHCNPDTSPLDSGTLRPAELADAIKRRIEARAGGHIRSLDVAVTGDQVAVRGSASRYYYKQLALQGLLDTNGALGARRIDFRSAAFSQSKPLKSRVFGS
jgi:hypothetical protein